LKLFCLLLVFCSSFSFAQSSPSQEATAPTPESATSSRFIVIPELKDPSRELTAADIELKLNGRPATITGLRKLGRVPMRYCVLFDVSGSERFKFDAQQSLAAQVLSQVVNADKDHGWLTLVTDEPVETTETESPQPIIDAIRRQIARGGTALYDAMAQCSQRMQREATQDELRVMFVFSDGEDDAGHINHTEAGDSLVAAGIRVYAIAPEFGEKGKSMMSYFVRLTGGRKSLADNDKSKDEAVTRIAEDLKGGVEVIYDPSGVVSKNGKIKVQVKIHNGGAILAAEELSH
jgi:hypothetical protein